MHFIPSQLGKRIIKGNIKMLLKILFSAHFLFRFTTLRPVQVLLQRYTGNATVSKARQEVKMTIHTQDVCLIRYPLLKTETGGDYYSFIVSISDPGCRNQMKLYAMMWKSLVPQWCDLTTQLFLNVCVSLNFFFLSGSQEEVRVLIISHIIISFHSFWHGVK